MYGVLQALTQLFHYDIKKPTVRLPAFEYSVWFYRYPLNHDEQFCVVLRTRALSRFLNNALHGETSTSSASPPFFDKYILKGISLLVKQGIIHGKANDRSA